MNFDHFDFDDFLWNFKIAKRFVYESSDVEFFTIGKPWLSAFHRWQHQRLETHKQEVMMLLKLPQKTRKNIKTITFCFFGTYENSTKSIKIHANYTILFCWNNLRFFLLFMCFSMFLWFLFFDFHSNNQPSFWKRNKFHTIDPTIIHPFRVAP